MVSFVLVAYLSCLIQVSSFFLIFELFSVTYAVAHTRGLRDTNYATVLIS